MSIPLPFFTRRRPVGRRGTAAIEFALVAPILITILFAVVDIGGAIQQKIRLEASTRSAIGYAHVYSNQTSTIRNIVINALNGWNDVTVNTVTLTCECGATANNVTTWSSANCAQNCATGEEQRRMLAVNVSRNYSGLVYLRNRTLRGDITMRVQ